MAAHFSNAPKKSTKTRGTQKYSMLSQLSEIPQITSTFFETRKAESENRFDVALIRPYQTEFGALCTNRVYLSYGATTFGRSQLYGLVDKEIAEAQAEIKVSETESYVDIQIQFLSGMPMAIKPVNSAEFIFPLDTKKIYTLSHGDAIFVGNQVFYVEVVKSQKATIQDTFQFHKSIQEQFALQPQQWSLNLRRRGPKNQPNQPKKNKKTNSSVDQDQKAKKSKKDQQKEQIISSVDSSPLSTPAQDSPVLVQHLITSAPEALQLESYSTPATSSPNSSTSETPSSDIDSSPESNFTWDTIFWNSANELALPQL